MDRGQRMNLGVVACLVWLPWQVIVAEAAEPSFRCSTVKKGSVEAMVCADEDLARLDRDLAMVYIQAIEKVGETQSDSLRAEQRGWIKGRDDCWKSADKRSCVRQQYTLRTAELQARYHLVLTTGPVTFRCDDVAETVLYVTYFATDPPTLVAERGTDTSLMYLQPSASGSRYVGRNESLWEHQGEALVSWGYDTPEMRCQTGATKATP